MRTVEQNADEIGETKFDALPGDYFQRRDPQRDQALVAKLEALGHVVTLQTQAAA